MILFDCRKCKATLPVENDCQELSCQIICGLNVWLKIIWSCIFSFVLKFQPLMLAWKLAPNFVISIINLIKETLVVT